MKRYEFIAAQKAAFPVSVLCRVGGVSRSGFYAWQGRPPRARALANRVLARKITEIHAGSGRVCTEFRSAARSGLGKVYRTDENPRGRPRPARGAGPPNRADGSPTHLSIAVQAPTTEDVWCPLPDD